jgi:hypothetical protein
LNRFEAWMDGAMGNRRRKQQRNKTKKTGLHATLNPPSICEVSNPNECRSAGTTAQKTEQHFGLFLICLGS